MIIDKGIVGLGGNGHAFEQLSSPTPTKKKGKKLGMFYHTLLIWSQSAVVFELLIEILFELSSCWRKRHPWHFDFLTFDELKTNLNELHLVCVVRLSALQHMHSLREITYLCISAVFPNPFLGMCAAYYVFYKEEQCLLWRFFSFHQKKVGQFWVASVIWTS